MLIAIWTRWVLGDVGRAPYNGILGDNSVHLTTVLANRTQDGMLIFN
jgi:hypothetical protein